MTQNSTTDECYRNDPKFSDRYTWAKSADPDQSDQGLHCLPFRLHRLDSLLYVMSVVKPNNSNFRVITTNFLGV